MKPGLTVLKNTFAIYQLDPDSDIPLWFDKSDFFSITRTDEEISVICKQPDTTASGEYVSAENRRIIRANGPFDLSLTGIIAGMTAALAKSQISVFTVSTYNTDYILVEEKDLLPAVDALRQNGYKVFFE
jgi:hypothetical protein